MNIGLFILYYLICTIVLVLIILFIIRFLFKGKCNIISRIAEKQIDDYFKAYDTDISDSKETLNFDENFDETINIIEEDDSTSSQNISNTNNS